MLEVIKTETKCLPVTGSQAAEFLGDVDARALRVNAIYSQNDSTLWRLVNTEGQIQACAFAGEGPDIHRELALEIDLPSAQPLNPAYMSQLDWAE